MNYLKNMWQKRIPMPKNNNSNSDDSDLVSFAYSARLLRVGHTIIEINIKII
jgi:hypothetical protein